jgi:ketosteroid isomerase-like protein
MAQENVEIVRSMLEAWEADGFEAAKDAFDAEVEVVDLQSAMGMRDRARGPEELLRMTEQWTDIFDDWGMEVSDLVDLGGDFVLADVTFSGVGRDSGIPVANRQFEVYRLAGGTIAEMRVGFHERKEALAWARQREGEVVAEPDTGQENVEVVRRAFEHFRATGDVLAEAFAPDFVWDMSKFRGWPERQTYPGVEGARQFLADWADSWEDWHVEMLEDLHDAGDRVVGIFHQRGRSKATGLPVEMDFAQVWTFRDGKQVRMEMYASAHEALEAVGVRAPD